VFKINKLITTPRRHAINQKIDKKGALSICQKLKVSVPTNKVTAQISEDFKNRPLKQVDFWEVNRNRIKKAMKKKRSRKITILNFIKMNSSYLK